MKAEDAKRLKELERENGQLRTIDGNDYRLVYATGHPKGLEVMKRACGASIRSAGAN